MGSTSMKSGFTLIELIFVIIVTGILAVVAIPKMLHINEQALETNTKSLIATLNNTVGPAMWLDQNRTTSFNCTNIADYIEPNGAIIISTECEVTGDDIIGAVTFEQSTAATSPRWRYTSP